MLIEKKIQLTCPIEINGKQVTELTMRKARVLDMRQSAENMLALGVSATQQNFEVHLFACLCSITVDDLDQMFAEDYDLLQDAYSFLKLQRLETDSSTQSQEKKNGALKE